MRSGSRRTACYSARLIICSSARWVDRPKKPRRLYHSFEYRAQSWDHPRRVVAKVEWRQGELFPRVGFIVTNLGGRAKRVVDF